MLCLRRITWPHMRCACRWGRGFARRLSFHRRCRDRVLWQEAKEATIGDYSDLDEEEACRAAGQNTG